MWLKSTHIILSDFEINKDDGTITSLKSFDYERDHNMDIRVQVSDGKHSVSTTVHVNIGNLNDNQPQFTNRTYYIDVEETVDKRIFPVSFILCSVKILSKK